MTAGDKKSTSTSVLAGSSYGRSRKTAHEFVRDVLRRAILSGELTGSTRLVQAELAETLEVSTTPVREALRDLASEGLIRFDPHRGAVVQDLSNEEVTEIYALREVLEPLALRQAVPRITDETIARIRKLHEKMESEPQSVDWVDDNRAFHMSIYESAASPRLAGIIRGLQDASVMYIGSSLSLVPDLRERANEDHAQILAALEARDVEAVVAAVVDHLKLSVQAMDQRSS